MYNGEDSGLVNGHAYLIKSTTEFKKNDKKNSRLLIIEGMDQDDKWVLNFIRN